MSPEGASAPLPAPGEASAWRRARGIVFTLVTIALCEALAGTSLRITNPGLLLALPIVLSAFDGGMRPGLASAALTFAYSLHFFREPGAFRFSRDDMARLAVQLIALPMIVAMVATLRRRSVAGAEEAARRSEETYRVLVENSDDPICLLDAMGRLEFASPAFERILGRRPRDLTGSDAFALVHPDDLERSRRALAEVLATGGSFALAGVRVAHGDGGWRRIDCRGTALRRADGTPRGAVVTGRDVTEQRRAEEVVRESEARLRAVLEHLPVGVAIADAEGRLVQGNPALRAIWGRRDLPPSLSPSTGTRGRDPATGAEIAEDDWPLVRAARRGETTTSRAIDVEAFDGVRRTLVLSAVPLRDAAGRVIGAVSVHVDVTERRALEERLLQSQKMEAVGRLAGGVAHDFNNLLTVIGGYAAMLLSGPCASGPAREGVATILQSSQKAAALTQQLLAFSRKQVLEPRVLDLGRFVAEVEPMLRRLVGEDVQVAVVEGPGTRRVQADPGRLTQVLLNLAANARDAMPAGGRLRIETRDEDLGDDYPRCVPEARAGPHVLLSVADTGGGMDEETRSHLFEPFFTTKAWGRGTGLGLPTVYGIVRQSGGHVEVDSRPGQGTEFRIYLPRVSAAPAPSAPAAAAGAIPSARGGETVLLAEDEEDVRDLARRMLEAKGYAVLEAADGERALAVARAHAQPIHLLLTDVVMPVMGGRDLAAALLGDRPGIRVLFMSGYTDDAVVRHGVVDLEAGFLQKPFGSADLLRKVRETLDSGIV